MWRASARSALLLCVAAAPLAAQAPPAGAAEVSDSAAMARSLQVGAHDSLGQLPVPEAAGRLLRPVTAADNSALVKDIEEKIRCTCGCNLSVYTCRTTDFECTVSPAMHRDVLARLDAGMSEAQVLASFEKQYGEMIFMEPPKRGFNWLAYIMPFLGLAVGLGLVTGVVRRWFRASPEEERAAADAAPAALPGDVSPEELENLKRELEKFEA
jgi:cytochrome c-type biogenesis protein CcmH